MAERSHLSLAAFYGFIGLTAGFFLWSDIGGEIWGKGSKIATEKVKDPSFTFTPSWMKGLPGFKLGEPRAPKPGDQYEVLDKIDPGFLLYKGINKYRPLVIAAALAGDESRMGEFPMLWRDQPKRIQENIGASEAFWKKLDYAANMEDVGYRCEQDPKGDIANCETMLFQTYMYPDRGKAIRFKTKDLLDHLATGKEVSFQVVKK